MSSPVQRSDRPTPPSAAVRRLLVAGTAGGVGTTSLTALVFAALQDGAAAPVLRDHTAGVLGTRLPDGDEVRRVDDRWELSDLGPLALEVGVDALADPTVVLTMVSAATPVGVRLATTGVEAVLTSRGPSGLARTVVALVGVHGRPRLGRPLAELRASTRLRGTVELRPDLALAAGGRIPLSRLSRGTRQAVDDLVELLQAGRRAQPSSWSWSLPDGTAPDAAGGATAGHAAE